MRQRLMIGALLLGVALSVPAHAEVKLAWVDVQRALQQSNAGKKAKTEFQSRVRVLEAKLRREQKQVKALKDELEKKGMLMKDEQRINLRNEYAQKLKNFERSYKDSREELQRKDAEVTGKIVRDLAQVIRRLGERNGYTVVLEKGSILWGSNATDITDSVIRTYNSMGVKPGQLGGSTTSGSRRSFSRSRATGRSTITK